MSIGNISTLIRHLEVLPSSISDQKLISNFFKGISVNRGSDTDFLLYNEVAEGS